MPRKRPKINAVIYRLYNMNYRLYTKGLYYNSLMIG